MMTTPALRYHGAKFRIAPWIISHFPKHNCYVDPFGGSAGVLLRKDRSYAEVYNDLDSDVVNYFRVIRDPIGRKILQEMLALTPYARDEFEQAFDECEDRIERARRLCIRAQMGFGSAGATKNRTGFRIDTKREYSTAQHIWAKYPDTLTAIGERFSSVLIENRSAVKVMRDHDTHDALHYVDPPYVFGTRSLNSHHRGYYKHEMSDADHVDLLCELKKLIGMVIVSSYETDLYNDMLPGWSVDRTQARISASRGTRLKTELVWMNPACTKALNQRLNIFE
ncbi:MAG: DNA adenine methylase [Nitrosomonas sp.]|nr:DNA adenine methylase [Nitrosomonas sp.]